MFEIDEIVGKIHCADSLEFMKNIPDNSIQLTVTSPPYFAYKDYGEDDKNIENFDSYEKYIEYMNNWLKELYRITDEDGRVCIIIDDKHTNLKTEGVNKNRGTHARLILLSEENNFIYKDLIIWAKARAGHASGGANYMLGSYPYPPNIPLVNWFEYVLILRKEGRPRIQRISQEQKDKSKLNFEQFKWASQSIWSIPAEKDRTHPCPFPKEIVDRLIRLFSFYGDIVFDPFAGSCTTAVVSKILGRKSISVELSEIYCKMGEKRLNNTEISLDNYEKKTLDNYGNK